MKKFFLTFIIAILISSLASSQDYKTGLGLRLGTSIGGTIKHFVGEKVAFEGLITTRWQGFEMTGLFEMHNRAFDVEKLNWYYGIGTHLGFYNGDNTPWGEEGENYTLFGIDGIIGIEYTFSKIPINLGFDWKPVFNLTGYATFWGDALAFSIRYTF